MVTLKIKAIQLPPHGHHLFVKATLNGQPVRLLLDTGASKTVFDKTSLETLLGKDALLDIDELSVGLGTSAMQGQQAVLQKWVLGKQTYKNYTVAVLDLSHVNQTYQSIGVKPIIGVLGNDILMERKAIINYQNLSLTLN